MVAYHQEVDTLLSLPNNPLVHEKKVMDLENLACLSFAGNTQGIHGVSHWRNVRGFGHSLLALTFPSGVQDWMIETVDCFAMLHDSRRLNDDTDPEHGPRAAEEILSLAGKRWFSDRVLANAARAARVHTGTKRLDTGSAIQAICLDADRLDLSRFAWQLDLERFSTGAGKLIAAELNACRNENQTRALRNFYGAIF
jgi:uncharacterized protein